MAEWSSSWALSSFQLLRMYKKNTLQRSDRVHLSTISEVIVQVDPSYERVSPLELHIGQVDFFADWCQEKPLREGLIVFENGVEVYGRMGYDWLYNKNLEVRSVQPSRIDCSRSVTVPTAAGVLFHDSNFILCCLDCAGEDTLGVIFSEQFTQVRPQEMFACQNCGRMRLSSSVCV